MRRSWISPLVRFVSLLFVLLLSVAPARGQEPISMYLRAGDWLRVQTHDGDRTTGTLVTVDDELLRLKGRTDQVVEWPTAGVQRLEVSLGQQRAVGAVLGAGAGLLGGVLAGVLLTYSDTGGEGANLAVIGVPLFTVPAGALLGALMAPHRFVQVPPPYRMTMASPDRP